MLQVADNNSSKTYVGDPRVSKIFGDFRQTLDQGWATNLTPEPL